MIDGPAPRFAASGARRIHWSDEGAGEPLVLLPGLGGGLRAFGTLPRRFARSGFRALTYDPAGIPPSSGLDDEFRFDDAARDVIAVLDAAGIERADLVGTSLGGKVAIAVAKLAPSRVRKLALLATSASITPRARRVHRYFAVIAECVPADRFGDAIAPFLFGASFLRDRPQVVDDILRATRPPESTRALMVAQTRALLDESPAFDPRSIEAPALCIAGAEDTLTPQDEVADTASRIAGARFLVVPRAGHSLLLENAAAFDAVVAFLSESTKQ
ncbi:MAG: alpha/beta fold hydrolase [Planctomycetes bacterium]|nr:alpha/beta fold hydrolase [Planctomycetota bacterium]